MFRLGVHIPLPGPLSASWSPTRRHQRSRRAPGIGSLVLLAALVVLAIARFWIYLTIAGLLLLAAALLITALRIRNDRNHNGQHRP